MMDHRHDELSTADLAGQRPGDVETDADRADRADRMDRMDRVDEDDLDSGESAIADDVDPDLDRPGDGNGQASGPLTTTDTDTGAAATSGAGAANQPLLASSAAEGFRARWTDVQTGFVDEPRHAVESADRPVAELMRHLAKTFADERNGLERQWDRGDDVSTDDLRTAFQRYRSFFERLLST
jgi:hypothetical protein